VVATKNRHCEERSDEAISLDIEIALLGSEALRHVPFARNNLAIEIDTEMKDFESA
jgi:hypothetical protein